MLMRCLLCFSVAAYAVFSGNVQAAEPSSTAQSRAELYQKELRAAFAESGWFAVEDRPGRLEVEHALRPVTAVATVYAPGRTFAHLVIIFRADSARHTATSMTAARYIRSGRPGRLDYPPTALHNPEVSKVYLDALDRAETRLDAAYPRYGAPTSRPSNAKAQRGQVAAN